MVAAYLSRWLTARWTVGLLCWAAWAGLVRAEAASEMPAPEVLTLEAAVWQALQNNPELAALRQQHGIAEAGVIIAQTYPFNPVWDGKVRATTGPESAGITNAVSNEHKLLIDVEVHHQGRYRRERAFAALTRTEWEIAFQETALAVRVVRAFNGLLYRRDKLQLVEQAVQLNDDAARNVAKLVENAQLRAADLILARTEVDDVRSQLGYGRSALSVARHDLVRALGLVEEPAPVQGTLDTPLPLSLRTDWEQTAVEKRADLKARQAAAVEADAAVRLAIAGRCGNPNVGPAYEYDPTRVSLIGVQFTVPLPICNRHKGEIMQAEAERLRAVLEVQRTTVEIKQDVQAALARLESARALVRGYQDQALPNLRQALKQIEQLFAQNEPGVDEVRVLDIRRKLLKARDGYLDALWELRQAEADLAAAVGDPAVAVCPSELAPKPESP